MVEEENEKILFVWGEPLTTQVLAAIEAWTGIQNKKNLLVIGCQIGNQFQKHQWDKKLRLHNPKGIFRLEG